MPITPKIIALVMSLGIAMPAAAAVITYDIEFDTPTLDVAPEPLAEMLNALTVFGPTITGSVTIDTDKRFINSFLEREAFGLGDYTALSSSFEWDAIIEVDEHSAWEVEPGTLVPILWDTFYYSGATGLFIFGIQFSNDATVATLDVSRLGISPDINLTNFSLTERAAPSPVPLPAGAALLLTGLATIGAMRRRRSAGFQATQVPSLEGAQS